MGQGPQISTKINQGQLGGQFGFHSNHLGSLKASEMAPRLEVANIKPGFVEFGLGCPLRVYEHLRHLCILSKLTLGTARQ